MTIYHPREAEIRVGRALDSMPVVALTGMRQVGKSTLLGRAPGLRERRYVSLDDFVQLEAAKRDPEAFLRSDEPLTIDEAQRCPELLSAVKREVDADRRPGRYLLSGSANFALLKGVSESLAGRAAYLVLPPFIRREMRAPERAPPFLLRFFRTGRLPAGLRAVPVRSEEVLAGGMPPVCLQGARDPALWFRGYEQTYLERDLRELSQVADLIGFRQLLRLAALRTGQLFQASELARDAKLSFSTAARYLGLLEASFLVVRLPPYLANRASRLIKTPKLYIADSGLACHLSGVGNARELDNDPMAGALFETYAAQNLAGIIASCWPEARLAFWSMQGRHEVDFVVECGRESMAVEVKRGGRWKGSDLSGLRAFLDRTPHCRAAILAHNGRTGARLGDRLWAIPLGLLLS